MIRVVIPASVTPQRLELTEPQWAALTFSPDLPAPVEAKLAAVAPVSRKVVWLTGAEVDAVRVRLETVIWQNPHLPRCTLLKRVDAKLAALQARAKGFERPPRAAALPVPRLGPVS